MKWFIKNVVPKLVTNFYTFKHFNKKSQDEQQQTKDRMEVALREIDKEIEGPYAIGK
jgi:hypothetical protein